ncbi:MAG: CDP-glycerol glycerophosphotransferase family protein [Oscillospiraceae bacterium]|jgi:CDP-ribitol ribitolphosphotransferase|nr:CDP-glycerol glycerophosphotransferase family protein [Oscillospiraceae bacterium]
MKSCFFDILIALARVAYRLVRCLPVQDKVIFLSRQSDAPLDLRLVQEELARRAPHLRQKTHYRRLSGDGTGSLGDFLALIRPTLDLARARGCFVDGQCIPLSLFRQRRGFVAVQLWHALGAVKQFGWQAVGKRDGHTRADATRWRMHENYTFIPCASAETQRVYAAAFRAPTEKIPVLGMPRVDEILRLAEDETLREAIYADHPTWRGMTTILYLPTFRKGQPLNLQPLLKVLDRTRYKLIVRVHPNDAIPAAPPDVALTHQATHNLLGLADIIVTDYSASAIEASLAGKPLYFYVPDLADYRHNQGLNIDIEQEMPGCVFTDFSALLHAAESVPYATTRLTRFREKYVEKADRENTARIVSHFLSQL